MLSVQHENEDIKTTLTPSINIPNYSSNYQNNFCLTLQQMPVNDLQHVAYILSAIVI